VVVLRGPQVMDIFPNSRLSGVGEKKMISSLMGAFISQVMPHLL